MVLEIGLTQQSVLSLGSPLYAVSVVLAVLLVGAGLSGRLVARLGWSLQKTTFVADPSFLVMMALVTVGPNRCFRPFCTDHFQCASSS